MIYVACVSCVSGGRELKITNWIMSKFLLFSLIFESGIDVIEAMLIAMQSIPMIQFTDANMGWYDIQGSMTLTLMEWQ